MKCESSDISWSAELPLATRLDRIIHGMAGRSSAQNNEIRHNSRKCRALRRQNSKVKLVLSYV